MADYSIGIEIEVCVEPHKIRRPLDEKHALYYEKLAAALRNRGLQAKANDLTSNRKYPDNYRQWWITRDGSLEETCDITTSIPLEAVSPVMRVRGPWEHEIDTYWAALRAVFHMPDRDDSCGSHVHISRGLHQHFTLRELKTIAYGVLLYEPLVTQLLLRSRRGNRFCRPNGQEARGLRVCQGLVARAGLIGGVVSAEGLRDVMQDSRYVLWNFGNAVPGRSGTIEFRGGRGLRGEVRTKRWIAFAVAFIHAVLSMNDLASPGSTRLSEWSPAGLYEAIKTAAGQLGMARHLPYDYRVLNETR
ncbi:putative amidoligase [Staphylotrichum tortipilum]|uniref:Amidoligase n=1 Tax=Staphylotrichum tortipilum TaxID=2831512 RepID=A0AAN6MA92_9PEZI|nr:putative amidoligase [Staphylotrichum longicolle]